MTIHRFKTSLLSAEPVLGLTVPAEAQPALQGPRTLPMPAVPLGAALRQLARLSGLDLDVDDELVAGSTGPALSGRFSPEDAVRRLPAGSRRSSRTVDGTPLTSGLRPVLRRIAPLPRTSGRGRTLPFQIRRSS